MDDNLNSTFDRSNVVSHQNGFSYVFNANNRLAMIVKTAGKGAFQVMVNAGSGPELLDEDQVMLNLFADQVFKSVSQMEELLNLEQWAKFMEPYLKSPRKELGRKFFDADGKEIDPKQKQERRGPLYRRKRPGENNV